MNRKIQEKLKQLIDALTVKELFRLEGDTLIYVPASTTDNIVVFDDYHQLPQQEVTIHKINEVLSKALSNRLNGEKQVVDKQ